MKFGKVEHPELVDFTMPEDHPNTKVLLSTRKSDSKLEVFVGCAKWNRTDLERFKLRQTGDELVYYASQFNSIKLNASFYCFFRPCKLKMV